VEEKDGELETEAGVHDGLGDLAHCGTDEGDGAEDADEGREGEHELDQGGKVPVRDKRVSQGTQLMNVKPLRGDRIARVARMVRSGQAVERYSPLKTRYSRP